MTLLDGNDRLREIWQSDPWLNSQIVASTEPATNQFFEDGVGHLNSSKQLPARFVVIDDAGDTTRTRASKRLDELKQSYVIRLCGGADKPLTRQLANVFEGKIQATMRGQAVSRGTISDLSFESRRFSQIAGGLRLWTAQLTLTVHGQRLWQPQDVSLA